MHHTSANEHIEAVGGVTSAGTRWKLAQPDVIARIERGEAFFVEEPSGHRVPGIVAVSGSGHKYIKTVAYDETPNNLLSLPECP